MPGNPRLPRRLLRLEAIEALLSALATSCPTFAAAVRDQAAVYPRLSAPYLEPVYVDGTLDPDWLTQQWSRLAEVPQFAEWLSRTYPVLAWLRRPVTGVARDEAVGLFAVETVPWIVAGGRGKPRRVEFTRDSVVGVDYRDMLRYWDSGRPNVDLDGPVSLQPGESEAAFLKRAKAHARNRLDALHARVEAHEPGGMVARPRALELHAAWWAQHHVEGRPVSAVAGIREDESVVRKAITKIGAFYK